jgi:mannitol/fructose-specific phosphotransferase system IIA component (Ntr-type)
MAIALADLLDEKQIALQLRARTQPEAMREIIQLVAANGRIDNPEKFLEQVRARELKNSTFADDGIAFPHARTELVDQIVLGIGRSEEGIPWSENGERAHLIFLIGVPEKLLTDYLVVIGAIARVTKDKPLRTLLLHAENVSDFIETMLASSSL